MDEPQTLQRVNPQPYNLLCFEELDMPSFFHGLLVPPFRKGKPQQAVSLAVGHWTISSRFDTQAALSPERVATAQYLERNRTMQAATHLCAAEPFKIRFSSFKILLSSYGLIRPLKGSFHSRVHTLISEKGKSGSGSTTEHNKPNDLTHEATARDDLAEKNVTM